MGMNDSQYRIMQRIKGFIPSQLKQKYSRSIQRLLFKMTVLQFVRRYDIEHPALFKMIEIETINRCNGTCTFCPVNVNEPQRPYAKMSNELFKKIIDELELIGFDGAVSLYSNNEPFLDERIIDFAKYAREKLPKANLSLFTNGSLLTIDKVKVIATSLDLLLVDNYSADDTMSDNLVKIKKYCENNAQYAKVVHFSMRKKDEILSTRGGQAPNKQCKKTINLPCFYPYVQLIVRPDGKCSLCCNDALGKYTLGDVNQSTLKEIWNSDEYKSIRKKMQVTYRKEIELCKYCDTQNPIR